MAKTKLLVAAVMLLIVGFTLGILLRPVVLPLPPAAITVTPNTSGLVQHSARSVQFFEANVDEARRVSAAGRESTFRGDECANAETAVTEADSK